MKVYRPSDVREMDAVAIASGIPGTELMRRAGEGVAAAFTKAAFPWVNRVVILCGKGNNAGDGFVAANALPWPVTVYAPQEVSAYSGDARFFAERLNDTVTFEVRDTLTKSDFTPDTVVIDALLGTGYAPPLRPWTVQWINMVNELQLPVISLDVPSGLDPETGNVDHVAMNAFQTFTFGVPKSGLFLKDGPGYVGRLRVIDIGIPSEIVERFVPVPLDVFTIDDARNLLSPMAFHSHKGSRGKVLSVCGSRRYAGAGALCAEASLTAGAGMVTLVTAETAVFGHLPNAVMVRRVKDDLQGFLTLDVGEIADLREWPDVFVTGPGLGAAPDAVGWVRYLLSGHLSCRKIVVDADGLHAVAAMGGIPDGFEAVLTPHIIEAERLAKALKLDVDPPGNDTKKRMDFALKLAVRCNAVVLLKGARTVVASPDGRCRINTSGTPGLATAGSGDVLAGIVGAFLGSGLDTFDAASLGAFVHGYAAETFEGAMRSLTADSLLRELPHAFRRINPLA